MTSISTSPRLLDRTILPIAELFALVLDGQLYRVGDAFATLDTPDTPALRASAFAAFRPGSSIADRGTAAWIHGTRSSPPPRPQVCVDPARRCRLSAEFDAHQHAISEGEVVSFADVRVTTPLRTAGDLLLTLPSFDRASAQEVRHLLTLAEASTDALGDKLRRSRRAGCERAIERLRDVERTRLPIPDPSEWEQRGLSPR